MPPRTAAATAARWANTIDVDELRRYIAGGMTTAAIATELGVSVKGVEKAKKRHNVRTYPPPSRARCLMSVGGGNKNTRGQVMDD